MAKSDIEATEEILEEMQKETTTLQTAFAQFIDQVKDLKLCDETILGPYIEEVGDVINSFHKNAIVGTEDSRQTLDRYYATQMNRADIISKFMALTVKQESQF